MVDWSELPDDLLRMIAVRLFSVVELKRFRSICTSWRRSPSVSGSDNNNPLIRLNQQHVNKISFGLKHVTVVSRVAFFRVILSSSPDKGWLIKSDDEDLNSEKLRLLDPLTRLPLEHWKQSIDLLDFTVSEIREAYVIHNETSTCASKRVVVVKAAGGDHHRVLAVGFNGTIRYRKGNNWIGIKKQMSPFSDLIVHKGITYALDLKGRVWWISSDFKIFRYGPSLDDYSWRDKSFVECCGELYIADRLLEKDVVRKRKADCLDDDDYADMCWKAKFEISEKEFLKTVGFKVYKMDDDESGKWVEVSSLGDEAILMANDSYFSVSANEFYGCQQNSIYFTGQEKVIKVFKLDDGSITTMLQSCFEMFVPSFL